VWSESGDPTDSVLTVYAFPSQVVNRYSQLKNLATSPHSPIQNRTKLRHFSPISTNWFQGSALEPTELQALPADAAIIRSRPASRCEAEPREQCVPWRSQGTSIKNGGDEREVSEINSI